MVRIRSRPWVMRPEEPPVSRKVRPRASLALVTVCPLPRSTLSYSRSNPSRPLASMPEKPKRWQARLV